MFDIKTFHLLKGLFYLLNLYVELDLINYNEIKEVIFIFHKKYYIMCYRLNYQIVS